MTDTSCNTLTSMQDNKKSSIELTPKTVKLKVSLNELTAKERQVLEYILKRFLYTNTPPNEFIPISKVHFRKNCGKYQPSLKQLRKLRIIQSDDSYCTGIGQQKKYCKSYRINQDCFGGFILQNDVKKSTRTNQNRLLHWTGRNLLKTKCSLSLIEIDSTVDELVTDVFVNKRFTPLENIQDGVYYFAFSGRNKSKNPLTKDKILEIANERDLNALFCHSNRVVYLGEAKEIKRQKRQGLRTTYKELLADFATGRQAQFIERSDTNNRLTTPFTVFPTKLLQYLKFDNQDFIQHDISNSQFCILANLILSYQEYNKNGLLSPIIEKLKTTKYYHRAFKDSFYLLLDKDGNLTPNVIDFCDFATNGQLYEFVSSKSNLERNEAKKAMFIVAFASRSYNPPIKLKVKEAFKDVILFIDSIKKELPRSDKVCFAVLLQLIESYICIDNVLAALKKHEIPTLTRHDSFCVKDCDSTKAKLLIDAELSRVLPFGYSLKKEYSNPSSTLVVLCKSS